MKIISYETLDLIQNPGKAMPSRGQLLQQLEANLITAKTALEKAQKLEQAARNMLAVLTPEGEVETLAAKKLADILGRETKDV